MKSKLLVFALFVALMGVANISMAQGGHFAGEHPHQHGAHHHHNHHHHHQHRHHNRMRNGNISKGGRNHMHRHDHGMRHEERRMAYRQGGHRRIVRA